MPDLNELKKKIEERRAKPKPSPREPAGSGLPDVETLVEKFRKKYVAGGLSEAGAAQGRLGELRESVAGQAQIELQGVEWLLQSRQFPVHALARAYLLFKPFTHTIEFVLSSLPWSKELAYYLSSAGLPFTAKQFLALTSSASFLLSAFTLLASAYLAVSWQVEFPLKAFAVMACTLLVFLLASFTLLSFPRATAVRRAEQASAELPYALRQIATQLRTGVGLYKSFQDIAAADYGVLSEEFSRTVNEIEEGTETKDALEKFAQRTQSTALRRALLHINRALRTGGNLSDAMSQIAEDVSFELRMRTRDFSEKMNFFGVIFIVTAIVLPVFLAIIAGITNAPIGVEAAALSPELMGFAYLIALPLLLAYLIAYLVYSQPKV